MEARLISLIVAIARNGIIGAGGALPWRVPEDLRHFKSVTMGHTLIVGRRTWCGLPPLPGRRLVLLTRNNYPGGPCIAHTIEDAIAAARETDPSPIVIGGAEVYRAALPHVSRFYLTEIDRDVDGDTFFHLDRTGWTETERRAGQEPGVNFVTLERA